MFDSRTVRLIAGSICCLTAGLAGCEESTSTTPASDTTPTIETTANAADDSSVNGEGTTNEPPANLPDEVRERVIETDNGWYDPVTHEVYPKDDEPEPEAGTEDDGIPSDLPKEIRDRLIKVDTGWYDPITHNLYRTGAPTSPDPVNAGGPAAEAQYIVDAVQVTDAAMFSRAGESYFSHDGKWIIFQGSPRERYGSGPGGGHSNYGMYVAKLAFDAEGKVTGIEEPIEVSNPGSANTCGWFYPGEPWRILFGSTQVEPSGDESAGYQRGSSRYRWAFPKEMEVVTRVVQEVYDDYRTEPKITTELDFLPEEYEPSVMFPKPDGYTAECALSPDGRHIVYCSVASDTGVGDIWIRDLQQGTEVLAVTADGYDGGPFFSPDGTRICYRSDRIGNNQLQLFVADLAFDENGSVTGIEHEYQLTDNDHVNWAPYWHPSGRMLVYASSQVSHMNYEVFAIEVPAKGSEDRGPGSYEVQRITFADGFDGLPVFSDDGSLFMWTAQRGEPYGDEDRPSSQIWIGKVGEMPFIDR